MLDIKFVRENPEIVKQNIRNKFQDNKLELVDKVIELDKENREIKQEVEALRAERNKTSKQIGALMAQGKRDEAEEVKKQVAASGATQYHSEDCGFHISCSFDRNDCCLRIHIVGSLCLPACTSPYS